MSRRLTVKVDPQALSVAAAIRTAPRSAPLFVLTGRALAELARELGSMDAAEGYVLAVAEEINKPIGINVSGADGGSRTVFFAPGAWSRERLAGWAGGHHEELEDAFGAAARVGFEPVRRDV
jgi:hypothetical protein